MLTHERICCSYWKICSQRGDAAVAPPSRTRENDRGTGHCWGESSQCHDLEGSKRRNAAIYNDAFISSTPYSMTPTSAVVAIQRKQELLLLHPSILQLYNRHKKLNSNFRRKEEITRRRFTKTPNFFLA
jgi:hypothetical protein